MKEKCTGNIVMTLSKPDAAGNMGYSISFDYSVAWSNGVNPDIKFSNVKFSRPGTWDEFSEGEDYPYGEMQTAVMADIENNTQPR